MQIGFYAFTPYSDGFRPESKVNNGDEINKVRERLREQSEKKEEKRPCSYPHEHGDVCECSQQIFPSAFYFFAVIFLHGAEMIRTVLKRALAHPGCYRSLPESLRTEVELAGLFVGESDAVETLRRMCKDDRQFPSDASCL